MLAVGLPPEPEVSWPARVSRQLAAPAGSPRAVTAGRSSRRLVTSSIRSRACEALRGPACHRARWAETHMSRLAVKDGATHARMVGMRRDVLEKRVTPVETGLRYGW